MWQRCGERTHRVHGRLGVLLDTEDGELEGSLEVGCSDEGRDISPLHRTKRTEGCGVQRTVGNVGLLVPERHRSNEPLHLYRLPREPLADKCRLAHHPLPALGLGLSRLEDLEHLVLGDSAHFGQGDRVLGRAVLSALLDGRRERLGVLLTTAEKTSLRGVRQRQMLKVERQVVMEEGEDEPSDPHGQANT